MIQILIFSQDSILQHSINYHKRQNSNCHNFKNLRLWLMVKWAFHCIIFPTFQDTCEICFKIFELFLLKSAKTTSAEQSI